MATVSIKKLKPPRLRGSPLSQVYSHKSKQGLELGPDQHSMIAQQMSFTVLFTGFPSMIVAWINSFRFCDLLGCRKDPVE